MHTKKKRERERERENCMPHEEFINQKNLAIRKDARHRSYRSSVITEIQDRKGHCVSNNIVKSLPNFTSPE